MKKIQKIIFALLIVVLLCGATIFYVFWTRQIHQPTNQMPSADIQKKDYAQILFVGDLMFDRGIRYYASQNSGNQFIFDKISPLLLNNDLVVANLEGPITNNKSVSAGTKAGSTENYFFTFDPSLAKTLFENNIRVVDLGNNHILNFGTAGVKSTQNYLDKEKVGYFGQPGGPRSISIETSGIKITFISYNQFSEDSEIEQKSVLLKIEELKKTADVIIIFCHWGDEYSQKPALIQQELAHQFIDAGADLVVGSHSHVIGPIEKYNGKKIYYSLGNFIFDQYFSEDVRRGLGVQVKIDKTTKQMEFKNINFYLNSNGQTTIKY